MICDYRFGGTKRRAKKCYAADRGRAGLVSFGCEVKVTVRAGKEGVNMQELCKSEILFRVLAPTNADQAKLEFILHETLSMGISRLPFDGLRFCRNLNSRNLHSRCTG